MNEREIFDAALQIADPPERAAFLDRVCAGDALQRGRIAGLLDAQQRLGSFLQSPPDEVAATLASEAAERPGAKIGPYKLLQQIGEGGMGVVYMAEQHRPVRRKVALKVIKPGMDTKEVIARFEAERQALAMMDHPNIAKVLDAGSTESGRPFFVMELVRGIPITDYCDRERFGTRRRLELFVNVCQAVQHAHQKGIIHRDIKPSNVLITEHDGTPVPKVIDFGVAKAINQQLTERTIFTRFQQMVGTPMYMSPEQADLSGLDVDTRADIYSLGVLLYELLTGTTPFDKQRFRVADCEEIRRLIRDEDPPKPSTRISTLGDSAATITELRRCDTRELRRQLRGEIDWIVMKTLEKDRGRRYETANGLAADVQRYLRNETVTACPPSRVYHFRKFVRRNRGALFTATLIGVVLVLATIVSFWQASVARTERNTVTSQRNTMASLLHDLRKELEEKVFLALIAGDKAKAVEAIERAELAGVPGQTIKLFRGQLALYYGQAEDAMDILQEVADESVAAQGMLATAAYYAQDFDTLHISLAALKKQLDLAGGELTFEDKLFAGHAMINSDMVAGGELVEQAVEERASSPLANMIHAITLSVYAHQTGDQDSMRRALERIKAAMRYVGDSPSPCLIDAHHLVQQVALTFDMQDEAGIEIEQLRANWKRIQTLPAARTMLIRLLACLQEPDVPDLIHDISSITEGEMVFCVPILLCHEPPTEVLKFFAKHRATSFQVEATKARVMALLPNEHLAAERLCVELLHQDSKAPNRSFCLNTLLLLGKDQKVERLARELLDSTTSPIYYTREVVRFAARHCSIDQFLAGASDVKVYQLIAGFAVGMHQFARREQEAAFVTLRSCDETDAINSREYWWARAIVKAMSDDPVWKLEMPAAKG